MNISSIDKKFGSMCDRVARSKFMQKQCEKGFTFPAKFEAAMLVTSIVSKDLIGCAVYTTQSWNNQKIPEEKRKFVALTDLTNGIIMVGGQLLAGKVIENKLGPYIFGRKFSGQEQIIVDGVKKYKGIPETKAPLAEDNVYGRYINIVRKNQDKLVELGIPIKTEQEVKAFGDKLVKEYGREGKQGKAIQAGFGIIVIALGTTALVKRTLAPLLSTPMASWIKKKYVDKPADGKDKKTDKENESEQKQNLDDKFLDHTQAPWAYSNFSNK